jgi:hypothetical protein
MMAEAERCQVTDALNGRFLMRWDGRHAASRRSDRIGLATSAYGPSRHFAASHQFGRFRSEADSGKPSARQIYGFTA